ncbi:uncharacterized protein LOC111943671 [Cyanistes caeruleus]|uniref:uncharacterized protein LOC111943671 n=1 Tax=Cyanistes caeruleus TaxID=156563 RepID=UPI000CDB887A|nr:uncharacterized protein LOC111943671 [Cyanistes caeruleus]XP_023802366.1 uncharacterized protein LOC111943671 [Cyanistes caeruleus]
MMDMEQPRELNTSPVLSLKPKEPSLGDHGTVTLAVALTLSTEGDVSSLDNSRTNSYPPQHLLGHKGKTGIDDLKAKRKKKLYNSKSTESVKSIVPHQPQPARLKDMLEKASSNWDQEEMESHLNWQALNPWDVAGVFYPSGHLRDEEEVPAARKNYVRTHKWHKNEDSNYWIGPNQLFYHGWRPVELKRKPKTFQILNRNLDFLSDPLAQIRPVVSSRGEAVAEREHSSLGGHRQIMPATTEEEGSVFLNKPVSPQISDLAPVPKELLDTTVNHHLRLLEPDKDKGLRSFMAHVKRALRMDCSLPQLKQACAKMVLKMKLLLKELSKRQENQGASDPMDQCPLQDNISRRTALVEDKELTGKKLEAVVYVITFVVLLSFFVFVSLILKCVFHVSLV